MRFTDKQIEAISQIYIDLGKIVTAVLVIGHFVSKGLMNLNVGLVVFGVLSAACLASDRADCLELLYISKVLLEVIRNERDNRNGCVFCFSGHKRSHCDPSGQAFKEIGSEGLSSADVL